VNAVCTAAATLNTTPDPVQPSFVYNWIIPAGRGSCAAHDSTYFLDFSGTGTSLGLGECSGSPSVANLDIALDMTFTSSTTGLVSVVREHFTSLETTYPISTSFTVEDNAHNTLGAGVLFTHIFAHCPPGGTSSTSISWTQ
jgi:hypothetical protein